MALTWILFALVAVCTAEDCVMSDWGAWTEWTKLDCGEEMSGAAAPTRGKYQPHVASRPPSTQQEGRVICTGGMAGEWPCSNVDQMQHFTLDDICAGNDCGHQNALEGRDVYGWDGTDGVQYGIFTTNYGTGFLKIEGDFDVTNPVMLAWMEGTNSDAAGERDVVVVGNYAYVTANSTNHGMQIVDLVQLTYITQYPPEYSLNIIPPTAVYNGFGVAQNLVTSPTAGFLYAAGANEGALTCNGGLFAMNIDDPIDPDYVGCFGSQGKINDAYCKAYTGPDEDYFFNNTASEICYAFNGVAFVLIDADDKADMHLITAESYPGEAFAAQGTVENGDTICLSGDTEDELENGADQRTRTYIWDITDLDAPFRDFTFTAEYEAIDLKQYIQGDWSYQANSEAGIRVMRIDQFVEDLTELGYFDLKLDDPADGVLINTGATGVFAGFVNIFNDGIVLAATREDGFFILRADFTLMEQMVADGTAMSERYRYRTIESAEEPSLCPNTVEVESRQIKKYCEA